MRIRLVLLGALVLCLLALGACDVPLVGIFGGSGSASSLPRSAATLSGSSWVLTQLHHQREDSDSGANRAGHAAIPAQRRHIYWVKWL